MSTQKKFFGFGQKERPDLEAEDRSPTLLFFFKLLWRKLGKLVTLNLMMDFMIFPLVAVVLIYLFGRQTLTVGNAAFAPLLGVKLSGGNAAAEPLFGIFGNWENAAFPTTTAAVVMIVLLALLALTWGWQNVGATYNLRSLVRGDSCFLWSDYFYAIKRNFRQGFVFGLLDLGIIVLLIFDWFYFSPVAGDSLWFGFTYFMIIALFIIYMFMRFYLYLMLITFDLPIKKLLKNGLIFSMLGIKRNVMALLGIALVATLNFFLIWPSLSIGFVLPIILPFFYLPALAGFMATYAAYPNIKRYMIDGDPTLTSITPVEDEYEEEGTEIIPSPPEAD